MSAVYFSYSGLVGGDHFLFDSKCMKNDVWLSFKTVPVDPPTPEPNNLTVVDSDILQLHHCWKAWCHRAARDVLTTAKVVCRASDTSRIRSRGMVYWINACFDCAGYCVSICVCVYTYIYIYVCVCVCVCVIFTYLWNEEISSDVFTRINNVSISLNTTCCINATHSC